MNWLRRWWRKRRELASLRKDMVASRLCVRAAVEIGLPPTGSVFDTLVRDAVEAHDKYHERKARP